MGELMSLNLKSIGMEIGARYEAVYTTMNMDGEMDAAPIGVKCIDENRIAARIFEGSKTLENIMETNKFVVNITENPKIYADSLYDNLDDLQFVRDGYVVSLENADAYVVCNVMSIDAVEAQKDHVNDGAVSYIVKSECSEIVIKKEGAKALNRGLFAFLESLVDYTRVDVIGDAKKQEYITRFKENERLIERVAEKDVKESMIELKEKMIEKGLEL